MPSEQKGAYGGHLALFWRSRVDSLHKDRSRKGPPDALSVEPISIHLV